MYIVNLQTEQGIIEAYKLLTLNGFADEKICKISRNLLLGKSNRLLISIIAGSLQAKNCIEFRIYLRDFIRKEDLPDDDYYSFTCDENGMIVDGKLKNGYELEKSMRELKKKLNFFPDFDKYDPFM